MRRFLVTVTTVLAVAFAGTPAQAAPATPVPGAPGIGDSYFPDYGNGGYDVGHYDIRLRYWPGTDELAGTTTILARATQDLSSFNLDFVLTVSSVRVNNRMATFARSGDHELVVTPARPLFTGDSMTVVVQYSGIPSSVKASGFTSWTRTPDGALAVNEPEIAWWWYPSNDHPLDKATEVISNGVMPRPPAPVITGWTRWSWRSTKPMATYLAFIAIGQYDIHTDTNASGQQVITAYSTALGDFDGAARSSVERTAEILEWESSLYGPYPFEAQGGVVVPPGFLGFALECQTRPVYSASFWRRGSNTYVVAHENAHQWFGDSVSVADWRNIWLNEGFARYTEWLWSEFQGEGTAQEVFDFAYGSRPADSPFWQVKPGDPGAADPFDIAVYDRGAMALHQLRLTVGDDTFFQIMRDWAASRQYGNGTIEQFEALAEQISGRSLTGLFTLWLFTPGRPDLGGGAGAMSRKAAPAQPRSWAKIQEATYLH